MYVGDFPASQTIDFTFTTVNSSGVPTTLAGTPALSCYKSNSTTQTTTGVTLTVDFDAVTGLNHVRIVTSDAFYTTATDFHVVITAGTVGGSSVVGYVVATFSIENRASGLNAIADAILKRDMSAVTGEAARSLLNSIRFLRNKWIITGTTLTVMKEDDASQAWSSTITATAGANPITASDPA